MFLVDSFHIFVTAKLKIFESENKLQVSWSLSI